MKNYFKYTSAVSIGDGDHFEAFSDTNILCSMCAIGLPLLVYLIEEY